MYDDISTFPPMTGFIYSRHFSCFQRFSEIRNPVAPSHFILHHRGDTLILITDLDNGVIFIGSLYCCERYSQCGKEKDLSLAITQCPCVHFHTIITTPPDTHTHTTPYS